MPTTVLLVDDHELIRQGLRRAFEHTGDFSVAGEAGSVAEALALVKQLSPDVVVVDVRLPDGSGLDAARSIRDGSEEIGIVVLTMYAGDEQLFGALEAGASAFVPKDAPAEDVIAAARHAAASPRAFTAHDLAGAMQRRLSPTGPSLSPGRRRSCLSSPMALASPRSPNSSSSVSPRRRPTSPSCTRSWVPPTALKP